MFSAEELKSLRTELEKAGATADAAQEASALIGRIVWCFGQGKSYFRGKCRDALSDNEHRDLYERSERVLAAIEELIAAFEEFGPRGFDAAADTDWLWRRALGERPLDRREVGEQFDERLRTLERELGSVWDTVATLSTMSVRGRSAPRSGAMYMFMQCAWVWKKATDRWPAKSADKTNRSQPKAPLHRAVVELLRTQTKQTPRGVGVAVYINAIKFLSTLDHAVWDPDATLLGIDKSWPSTNT